MKIGVAEQIFGDDWVPEWAREPDLGLSDTHFRTPGLPVGTLGSLIWRPRGPLGARRSPGVAAIRIRALFSSPKVAKVLRIWSELKGASRTEVKN